MNNDNKTKAVFDPLDMNNYRIEKLPKMQKSGFERVLQRIGAPLALLAFILIYWVVDIPFVDRIDTNKETTTLTSSAMKRYKEMPDATLKQLTSGEKAQDNQQNQESTTSVYDKYTSADCCQQNKFFDIQDNESCPAAL